MAENKSNDLGVLEKLALLADSFQDLFKGQTMVVFELNKEEYTSVINHFREIDRHHKQFTIEISGTDFVFMLKEEVEK
jgi:hypothetical protein